MKGRFHTEDLNSYKFWILTSGIDTSRYEKNNILLKGHDYECSVGKVLDLVKLDGNLEGEVEFDEQDEDGQELKRKYDKGYQKAFSIGIDILETSAEAVYMKPGQSRPTVTKCELIEISAITVPSNQNAIVFYKGGKAINLSLNNEMDNLFPQIKTDLNMKKIALKFGLTEAATEAEILDKVELQSSENATLKAENAELKLSIGKANEAAESLKTAGPEALLSNPKKAFSPEQKETYRKLAKVDYDNAVKLIGLQPEVKNLAGFVAEGKTAPDKHAGKTFSQLQKEDSKYLTKLRAEKPEDFKQLYFDEFGRLPNM